MGDNIGKVSPKHQGPWIFCFLLGIEAKETDIKSFIQQIKVLVFTSVLCDLTFNAALFILQYIFCYDI